MSDFSFIPPISVHNIPGAHASAAFTSKTSEVFKEEHNIAPIIINDKMKYIPLGGDNQMPYNIINFLTGMENSGKVLFSTFYVSPNGEEQHDVVINKIETDKEGGDWATDIVEAINMMCFTMRVHSNLVGSVPGKSQTNNSGSDKRELYTIAQALQKPYQDLLFSVHRLIIRFNKWTAVKPDCPFIQLTTLDENKDAKQVSLNKSKDNGNADK